MYVCVCVCVSVCVNVCACMSIGPMCVVCMFLFIANSKLFHFKDQCSVRQWRAEAVGCPGPTRFLDVLEKYFVFLSQNF